MLVNTLKQGPLVAGPVISLTAMHFALEVSMPCLRCPYQACVIYQSYQLVLEPCHIFQSFQLFWLLEPNLERLLLKLAVTSLTQAARHHMHWLK